MDAVIACQSAGLVVGDQRLNLHPGQAPLDAAQLPDGRTPRILEPRVTRDLIAWTQRLALDGALAICERETLRYRLLHTASRLAFHAPARPCAYNPTWP